MLQRSDEWFSARVGALTASRLYDAIAVIKGGGYSASREKYKNQLVVERLTGLSQSDDIGGVSSVQWGVETEAQAKSCHEFLTGITIDDVGFVAHPIIKMSGASPDGLIGDDGVIEIKCPNTTTHISYLKSGIIPPKYKAQLLWQIACTGRLWGDFVSFDPRLDFENQLLVIRFAPSNDEIKKAEEEVQLFLDEVAADELWLRNRGRQS